MKRAGGLILWVGLLFLATVTAVAQQPIELEVRARSAQGEFEFDEETGIARDPEGIVARYGGAEITAKSIRFNRLTGEVDAEGDVRLQRGGEVWSGERIRYNFETGEITADNFRAGVTPFFAAGEGLAGSLTNEVHAATNAFVTTDDRANPRQRIKAKSLTIVPGKYIEVRGATLYVGKVPVFYVPKVRRRLDGLSSRFTFVPGYRSRYGPYLLSTYTHYFSTNLTAAAHLDWRQKRGLGGGLDLFPDLGRAGKGGLLTYYMQDDRPGTNFQGGAISEERGRIWFEHSAFINTNLSFRAAVKHQSDELIVRDFFEDEYRREGQPKTFVEASQFWPNLTLSVLARPRVNDFYQVIERLPDIGLTAAPLQVGRSPLYFQSESSVAHLRFQYDGDTNQMFSALRADTFNQVTLPKTFFGWLNVTPRVGGRFTHYANERGTATPGADHSRWVFNTGAEVSTRMSRVWPAHRNRLFDVDGLRHILEPSINYVFVPDPSTPPTELPQFDYLLPTYKLLPIEYPQFNAIDAVDSQNVMRFGLRNRFQTKRNGTVENLVHWALLMDWRLDPAPGQRSVSDLYSDLDWRIRSWLVLNSELRYDFDDGQFNLAGHVLTIEPNDRWGFGFGHRYLREWPGGGVDSGYDLLTANLYFKLTENWAFRFWHYYDLDLGHLQEQYYTIYRDFGNWTGGVIFRVLEDAFGERDYTLGVGFSLKSFPSRSLGTDKNVPRYLLGG
jgi:lipopolysaccharide assembly outer membrane protein LptD (OstA)